MFESSIKLPTHESLAQEIVSLASRLSSGTAQLIGLIGEFDRNEGWRDWGCSSTAEWLAWQCGRVADDRTRTSPRFAHVEEAASTFEGVRGRGELSYSKVRAVTRIATEENESDLVEAATRLTASELEGLVRASRRGRAVTDPTYALRNRSVRRWPDKDGMWNVLARVSADDCETVWRGLAACEDAAGVSAETEDENLEGAPPAERRRADALVALAQLALDGARSGRARRAVPLVMVHADGRDATIRTTDGSQVSAATAERLLCDAAVVRVSHHPSGRVELGRATRVISGPLRRLLELRDSHCQFPGCANARYLDGHHRKHWLYGGSTDPKNTELICTLHHKLVHEGGYTLIRDGDRRIVAARSPSGRIIEPSAIRPNRLEELEPAVGWP